MSKRPHGCRANVKVIYPGLLVIVFIALFSSVLQSARAAVTLVYFQAIAQIGQVELDWETATELDTAGFFVNRSLAQNSGYTRISNFIPSQGDPFSGGVYSFIDVNVTNGTTYWYLLESIDINQGSVFYQPPVSAIPGVMTTNTPTATRTPTTGGSNSGTVTSTGTTTVTPTITRTATRTPSAITPSRTPTRTRTFVFTQPSNLFRSATPTIGVSSTPTASLEVGTTITVTSEPVTATATLIPLPELTLIFPTPVPTPLPAEITPTSFIGWLESHGAARILFIVFVILIWIVLGSWFYYSFRRLG